MNKIIIILTILFTLSCDREDIFEITEDSKKIPAPDGTYLIFNGTDTKVIVTDYDQLSNSNSLTAECYAMLNSTATTQQFISKWGPGATTQEYKLTFNSSGPSLEFHVADGVSASDFISVDWSTLGIGTGKWFHVAGTFESGELKIYINGSLKGSKTSSITSMSNTTYTLHIGELYSSSNLLDGALDEVRIFNYAKTEGQVNMQFDAKANVDDSGLVLYYEFNEGTGTNVNDSSANGFDSTITGTPGWGSW